MKRLIRLTTQEGRNFHSFLIFIMVIFLLLEVSTFPTKLQVAFRESSAVPDEPGHGPGEKYTGPVW